MPSPRSAAARSAALQTVRQRGTASFRDVVRGMEQRGVPGAQARYAARAALHDLERAGAVQRTQHEDGRERLRATR